MKQRTEAVFALPRLMEDLRSAAMGAGETVPALAAARLADGLRDAGLPVPRLAEWATTAATLDGEAWARLDVLVRVLRDGNAGPRLAEALSRQGPEAWRTLPGLIVREARLLNVELLRKSPFRVEEMARKLVHVLGGRIEGETEAQSRDRLARLDYGGVLKNLEAADADRAARMKKLQEIEAERLKTEQEAYARLGRE